MSLRPRSISAPAAWDQPPGRLEIPLSYSASPAWSPDGRRLAFISSRALTSQSPDRHIVVQDAETQAVLMEVRSPGRGSAAQQAVRWMPGGGSLLVRAARSFHVIDPVNGVTIKQVPTNLQTGLFAPSADGRTILILRGGSVERFDPITGESNVLRRVSVQGRLQNSLSLVVSPDEQYLGLTSADDSSLGPFYHTVVPLDGREPTTVWKNDRYCRVDAWIDDTLLLVCHVAPEYSRFDWRASLFTLPVRGDGPKYLGLELEGLHSVALHPDGRRIAFVAGQSHNEIWALENLPPIRRR